MPETTLANVYVCLCVCVGSLLLSPSLARCVCVFVLLLLVWGFVLLINKHESQARAGPIVCTSVCVCAQF